MRVSRRAAIVVLGAALPAALLTLRQRGREPGRRPLAIAPDLAEDVAERLATITVLVFWDAAQVTSNRTWLPALNNLARVAAPLGLAVQGAPALADPDVIRAACRALGVDWPQRLAPALVQSWRSRYRVESTPWLVLLRAGTVVYSGPPRELVSELVALFGTYPYQDAHLGRRVVLPEVEVRLTLAGEPVDVGPAVWFEFGDALVGGRVYYPEVQSLFGRLLWRGLPEGTFDVVGGGERPDPERSWFVVARVGIPGVPRPEVVTLTVLRPLQLTSPFGWPRTDGRSEPHQIREGAPARFRWRGAREATSWRYTLHRLSPERHATAGDEWVNAGTTSTATVDFGRLPAGTYALRLEAWRGDGWVGAFPPAAGARTGEPSASCVFVVAPSQTEAETAR